MHEDKKQYRLSEIVQKLGGELIGEDIIISGISAIQDLKAKSSDITFVASSKYLKAIENCQCGAIVISPENAGFVNKSKIITTNPYLYYSKLTQLFYPLKRLKIGIKNTVVVGKSTEILEGAAISDYVVIGENCKIGKNVQIHSNVNIGDNVVIGDNVIIYSNCSIYYDVRIGNNCTLHSGSVIGSDGFGFAQDEKKHWSKIIQSGGVSIGNNVEIGANTAIDRGAIDDTIIEDGVIIDNLVQIAHNVKIGAYTAIAGCVGIAGGTKIGKYCQIGGASGIIGHIEITDYTVIGACTSIMKTIKTPNFYQGAYPSSTHKEWLKNAIYVRKLGQMHDKIKELERKIAKIIGG